MRQYSEDLPNQFCALLAEDADVAADAASWTWGVFEVISACERRGHNDPWLCDYIRNLLWPLNGWCREVCLSIGEMGGTGLPEDIER